jgi:flavin-dependent dehydrogenase
VTEAVFALAAEVEPGVAVHRGVRVLGLLDGDPVRAGVAHVTGVRTDDGENLHADLVVDATGRRTASVDWLDAIGARKPQVEVEDHGFVYYSRFYAGEMPVFKAPGASPIGSFSVLTLPSDNNTWAITVYGASRDRALKAVRDPECFNRLLRACPRHGHWLDGTPLTEVLAMAGISDSYRRFTQDGDPVVTGFVAVGDAWASTNPSAGRGLSIGVIHARALRAAVRAGLADPVAFQVRWDAVTEQQVTPFYRNQLAADRARSAEIAALQDGLEPPPPDPLRSRLLRTAGHEANAFRAMIELVGCLTLPADVFARPGLVDGLDEPGELPSFPGPDRQELLKLLAD